MSSAIDTYKLNIAEALFSSGELWELRSRTTDEKERDTLTRAVQNIGNLVGKRLALEGLSPKDGVDIYTEIMTTLENEDREVYQKMDGDLQTELLIVNSKKYV
jgi:hypothetical protein